MSDRALVVIGASWGGLGALTRLFSTMPPAFNAPILVVQHRSRHADNLLASLLQDITKLRVIDVEDKEPLEPGIQRRRCWSFRVLVPDEWSS